MINLLEYLVKVTTTHPIITLFIVLCLTGLALIPASNFTIETDIREMFGGDDPDIKMMENIVKSFGEQELVTVVIDCSKSNVSNAESYVERIAEELKNENRFKNVQYKQDFSFVGNRGILYLSEEYIETLTDTNITLNMIEAYRATIYEWINKTKYFASDNGRIYLINMGVNTTMMNPKNRESLLDDLGNLIKETKKEDARYEELDVGFTGGMLVIDYEGDKIAWGDFFRTVIITLILILVLLFISFRSLSLPLLSIIPLLIGVIWATGIIFLIYDSLNLFALAFAVLLLGLGIDFCIHLLTRFMDEMDEHHDVATALKHTFVHTGKAVILGCLTTVAAFFSLYFADTKALHQMGIIAALGLILTLAAVLICIPVLITLRLKLGKLKRKRATYAIFGIIGSKSQRFASFIVILMLIFSIGFAIKAQDAKLSDNIYDLLPTQIETYEQLEKVKDNFEYNPDFLVCLVESEPKLIRCVEEFRLINGLIKVESALDYLPSNQTKKLAIINQAIEIHPEFGSVSWLNVTPMGWSDLPLDIYHAWISDKQEFLVKITPAGDLFEKSYQTRLLSDLHEIHPNVTASAVIWTKMTNMITTDVIHVSSLVALAIFAIVYIGFRRLNPIYSFLSIIPVTFGILGLLGTYHLFGADLNFITIMMIPLIIGIGIDDGIHIIHRYLEEGKGSIPRVVQLTGKAIFLTTATTVLAFSSFLFSSHPTMRFLGRIPIIGLSMCFIGAILFLPALIGILIDKKFLKRYL